MVAKNLARRGLLLNQGSLTLAPNDDGTGRAFDTYGRSLHVVTRAGASLGETLADEGLADEWQGVSRELVLSGATSGTRLPKVWPTDSIVYRIKNGRSHPV